MSSVGPGVRKIRIRQASGAYRIIYLTTIGDVVHVLHAFQKKTQATAKRDIDLAKSTAQTDQVNDNGKISIPRPLLRGRSRRA
jgi:phage-related protein